VTTREEILAARTEAIASFAKSALVALEHCDAPSAIGDVRLILSLATGPVSVDVTLLDDGAQREAIESLLRRPR
jgi:hypothetical protein